MHYGPTAYPHRLDLSLGAQMTKPSLSLDRRPISPASPPDRPTTPEQCAAPAALRSVATHVDCWIAPLRIRTDTGKKQERIASFTGTPPSTGSCHNLTDHLPSTHAATDQRCCHGHAQPILPARAAGLEY